VDKTLGMGSAGTPAEHCVPVGSIKSIQVYSGMNMEHRELPCASAFCALMCSVHLPKSATKVCYERWQMLRVPTFQQHTNTSNKS
jgi:hypothetical protein